MGIPNLSIVFSPGLIRSDNEANALKDFRAQSKVFELLVRWCDELFPEPELWHVEEWDSELELSFLFQYPKWKKKKKKVRRVGKAKKKEEKKKKKKKNPSASFIPIQLFWDWIPTIFYSNLDWQDYTILEFRVQG